MNSLKKGRNTCLVPIFRGCFQFDPSDLKPFNWVPVFLSRHQFYKDQLNGFKLLGPN
jgi:hypothetical protein